MRLHAALQFKTGQREIASEDFARNLELQARVDTYLVLLLFVAFFRKTQKVSRTDRRWLRFHLFASQNPGAFQAENLRGRYLETTELAASYTQFLDTLNGMRRLDEIRRFRSLDYGAKKERILALMNGSLERSILRRSFLGSPAASAACSSGRCSCTRFCPISAPLAIKRRHLLHGLFSERRLIELGQFIQLTLGKRGHIDLGHVVLQAGPAHVLA